MNTQSIRASIPREFEDDQQKQQYIASLMTPSKETLPLLDVNLDSTIIEGLVSSTITQRFQNTAEKELLEVIYTFPLTAQATVISFTARVGDTVMQAKVMKKEEAKAKYEVAKARKNMAALVDQHREHIYQMSLANIPPMAVVSIEIKLVEVLVPMFGEYQFRFATTFPHYYMPGKPVGLQGTGVLDDTDQVHDASLISPPIDLNHKTKFAFRVQLIGSDISKIRSSMDLLSVEREAEQGKIILTPDAQKQRSLDRDLVISYRLKKEKKVITYFKRQYALIRFLSDETQDQLNRRILILIDISGSMDGMKLESTKLAAINLLKKLKTGDEFLVVSFDNECEFMSRSFLKYNNQSLASARAFIDALEARGGTEMYNALKSSINAFKKEAGEAQNMILMITDGEYGDEGAILRLARQNPVMIFCLGIDSAVNTSLLSKTAKYSNAISEFAAPNDDIEAIVNRLEYSMYAPVINQLSVSGYGLEGYLPYQHILQGRESFFVIKKADGDFEVDDFRRIKLVGAVKGESKSFNIDQILELGQLDQSFEERFLEAIWAKNQIDDLKQSLNTKEDNQSQSLIEEQLNLSIKHQVICPHTSWFLEIEQVNSLGIKQKTIVQPLEPAAHTTEYANAHHHRLPSQPNVLFSLANSGPKLASSLLKNATFAIDQQQPTNIFQSFFVASPPSSFPAPEAPTPAAPPTPSRFSRSKAKRSDGFSRKSSDSIDRVLINHQDADGAILMPHHTQPVLSLQLCVLIGLLLLGNTRSIGRRSINLEKLLDFLTQSQALFQGDPLEGSLSWALDMAQQLENATITLDDFKAQAKNQISWDLCDSSMDEYQITFELLSK